MRHLKVLLLCVMLAGCSRSEPADQMQTESEFIPDYSGHIFFDEEKYQTILGDPSKLAIGEPVLTVEVPPADWSERPFNGLEKQKIVGYDVRSVDITGEDLSIVKNYNDLTFSSDTQWPEILPAGFEPEFLLQWNENPGLGIRGLHEQGITGEGIGIAIIDQALYSGHEQYADNLMYYEQVHCWNDSAEMHGSAVASIAAGKTIGVAPGAKLYYIATTYSHFSDNGAEFDASIIADAIMRVLEINRYLPDHEKIRVISISRGYGTDDNGYEELTAAIEKAEEDHIFVLTVTPELYYDFPLFGMCRDYKGDPDDASSYRPATWVAEEFYADSDLLSDYILVPMGARTYAASTGPQNYELSYEGGLSWAVPWCAGFYALCCQVYPDLTPGQFIQLLAETGMTAEHVHEGRTYTMGTIVNPAAVIAELQK